MVIMRIITLTTVLNHKIITIIVMKITMPIIINVKITMTVITVIKQYH